MILVTGGAGFIGSNFVLDWLANSDEPVVNLDALTYAGNLENLSSIDGRSGHLFVHGDICDRLLVDSLLATHRPRAIVHLAAESHVDRSIHGPRAFMQQTSLVRSLCWKPLGTTTRRRMTSREAFFDSCMSAPMRCMGPSARRTLRSPRLTRTSRIAPILRARRPAITSSEPGITRMPAGADDQLQQQLRAVPFPRETDPPDDRQCARKQAPARVRRRHAGA